MGNGVFSVGSKTPVNHPIVFVDFDQFKSHGSIPRSPDCKDMCTRLEDIDREESFVIFVSHTWLNGPGCGSSEVDNSSRNKFQLIVSGVTKLIADCAPSFKKCYLWLDYCCLNQNENTASQLSDLETLVEFTDCLFTPLLGKIDSKLSYTSLYSETPQDTWNTPGSGYLQRSWCRMEMFFACNITTHSDSSHRINSFKKSMHHFVTIGKRPHYVYGSKQETENSPYVVLPLLQNNLWKVLTPEYGQSSVSEDNVKIMELLMILQPHMDRNSASYVGPMKSQKMHGKGIIQFSSGARYQGSFHRGKKHGIGTFVYASGNVYAGAWVDDLKHGHGHLRLVNGDSYVGNFKSDQKHGTGCFTWSTGDCYDGTWAEDKPHGQGRMKFQNGSEEEYNGEYFEGYIEGEGVMTSRNGEIYTGEFVKGQRSGHGVLRLSNGEWYEGQFIKGAMHGTGKYTIPGHEVYEGSFYEGQRSGPGTCLYRNGEYVGQWLHDKRHGKGKFSSHTSSGDLYIGDWLDDLKHGNGMFKSVNGTYQGQYQSGKLHGTGVFTYQNGDVYEGVWLNDKKQGKGTYVYAEDGHKWTAMWRDDELIEKVDVDNEEEEVKPMIS